LVLYNGLKEIIEKYRPEAIAVEELFFNKNIKTALAVGHGRGVAVLAAAQSGIDVLNTLPFR